jgi:hypothetical protein
MRKKPVISLIRGNTPKFKIVGRRSFCWRCRVELVKNDKVFDVPNPPQQTPNGKYYRSNKRYCIECMRQNILQTEKELQKVKDNLK